MQTTSWVIQPTFPNRYVSNGGPLTIEKKLTAVKILCGRKGMANEPQAQVLVLVALARVGL